MHKLLELRRNYLVIEGHFDEDEANHVFRQAAESYGCEDCMSLVVQEDFDRTTLKVVPFRSYLADAEPESLKMGKCSESDIWRVSVAGEFLNDVEDFVANYYTKTYREPAILADEMGKYVALYGGVHTTNLVFPKTELDLIADYRCPKKKKVAVLKQSADYLTEVIERLYDANPLGFPTTSLAVTTVVIKMANKLLL